MKYLIAIAVWPIALAALPAKTLLFGGQIHVWPFLLAACAVTAIANWRAALIIAIGVAGAQIIQRTFSHPEMLQLALYSTLAFIALWLFDKVAGIAAAIVAIIYFLAVFVDWRAAMIVSEVVLVAGMSGAVLSGPTGGIYQRSSGADTAAPSDARVAVSWSGLGRVDRRDGLDSAATDRLD